MDEPVFEIEDLCVEFHTQKGTVYAVNGVSYTLRQGDTLGIVGESGCGKSVLHYAVMGLLPAKGTHVTARRAAWRGTNLLAQGELFRRSIVGLRMTMVFQDPMTALNPYLTVGYQVMEPLLIKGLAGKKEARERAEAMLRRVGLPEPKTAFHRFPHEFSGGMRQRAMIAMALITHPEVLIADEPTTALDATVQAQVLHLLDEMRREFGMCLVLITHDFAVVTGRCAYTAVMYAGQFVEFGPTPSLFAAPKHPYTRALLDALPSVHGVGQRLRAIPGAPPELKARPEGCAFAPRCPYAVPTCTERRAALESVAPGHTTACWRVREGEVRLE